MTDREFHGEHALASSDDLIATLTGIAIPLIQEGFIPQSVLRIETQSDTSGNREHSAKARELLNEDVSLAYSLIFDAEEAPSRGRELRRQLTCPARSQKSASVFAGQVKKRRSHPYVHNNRGRPKAEKHEWLRELWRFFLSSSSKKTIVNFNPRAKSVHANQYSGAFFLFARDFCRITDLPISDDELAKSIRRIILGKK